MKCHLLATAAVVAVALLAGGCQSSPPISVVDAKFRKTFDKMPVDAVKASEIRGLYEVYSGGKLFYFAPRENLLIFGELYSVDGRSVSQEKAERYVSERAIAVEPDVGTVVGDGDQELIAFIDPSCGHCREAHRWLESRNFAGMRVRFIFTNVDARTPMFPQVAQFLCAPEHLRREALRQVYAGAAAEPGEKLLFCDAAANQLAKQAAVAKSLGIDGTPTFVVNNQTVLGFQRERLESLLSH